MKKLLAFVAPATLLAAMPFLVLAQGDAGDFSAWEEFLNAFGGFLNLLVVIIIALAIVFFLWGLMLFILSAGDEEKRAKGKSIMIWGIIALVVMVAVWGIVNLLSSVLGEGEPVTPPLPI